MIVVGKCLHGRLAGCRGGSRSSLRCAQPRHLLRRPGTVVLCTPEPGNASTSTTSTKADVTSTSSTSGLPGPVLLEGAGAGGVLPAQGQDQEWRWEESSDALTAYGVLAAVLVAGAIPNPILRSDNASDLFYFVALAVCTQYIGAHRSLTTAQRQQLSIKEGLLAPVLASVSLFTCYLIIRFLPDINLSTLINAYFWLLGSFAASGALIPVLRQTGGPLANKSISFDVPDGWLADEHGKPITRAEIAPSDVIAVTGALTLATAHLITQDYTLNNTMACLIATDILQLIGIRSFRVAGALLVGLLLYDVFWVFGSPMVIDNGDNVMLTVATSDLITGPSRLLFPRTPGGAGEAADFPYSLLGLGDIAIPGLLACLALRYDASRAVDMAGRAEVAFNAMKDAWSKLPADASGKMMADTGSIAADAAFDKFADTEQKQRQQTLAASMNNGNTTATPAGNTSSTTSTSSSDAVRIPATEAVLSQRTYFVPVMVAYVGGLLVAFAANSITHMGQPALLYIVPSTLGALLVLAATRQEIRQLWSFTDVPSFGVPSATKDTAAGKESKGAQNN